MRALGVVRAIAAFPFCAVAAIGLSACSYGGQYGLDRNFSAQIVCQMRNSDTPQKAEDIVPWPPPRPSNEEILTTEILDPIRVAHGNNKPTLGDVDKYLTSRVAGVEDRPPFTYYTIPDDDAGFVAVTRVDPIDGAGTKIGPSHESGSSLGGILNGWLFPPEGRSRVLLLIVTNSPKIKAQQYSADQATPDLANKWIDNGCLIFPSTLAQHSLDPDHDLYVLAYEFVTHNGQTHLVKLHENPLSPSQHLAALGVSLDAPK
jgi:hypothetical protein